MATSAAESLARLSESTRGHGGLPADRIDALAQRLLKLTEGGIHRFTVAHELGYLLAGDGQGIHVDENIFGAACKQGLNEKRANAFAAAFLMPDRAPRESVGSGSGPRTPLAWRYACPCRPGPSPTG